jgi:cytochrome c biogenesis protein CcmG/thiol:disulfide interchange protein DsbE
MIGLRRLLMMAPLGIALAGGAVFYGMLQGEETGSFDPRSVPSPLIGKPMPDFTLSAQPPGDGFTSAEVRATGRPVLINFFASWCAPCVEEAPELMKLHRAGVPIWGIAFKDSKAAAGTFLARLGDPYEKLAADAPGRTAIDFGLYGVPETYFIDRTGIIRWRWAGPLTSDVVALQLRPLLRKYQ